MGMDEYVLQRERKDRFEEGYKKGFEIGFKQGVLKKTIEMVLSLFDNGFEVENISNLAKISTDKVIDILRDHNRI